MKVGLDGLVGFFIETERFLLSATTAGAMEVPG